MHLLCLPGFPSESHDKPPMMKRSSCLYLELFIYRVGQFYAGTRLKVMNHVTVHNVCVNSFSCL